jgi:hypothetical protein
VILESGDGQYSISSGERREAVAETTHSCCDAKAYRVPVASLEESPVTARWRTF